MINIDSMIKKTQQEGFKEEDATAKVCQDIILNAISRSSLNENITTYIMNMNRIIYNWFSLKTLEGI